MSPATAATYFDADVDSRISNVFGEFAVDRTHPRQHAARVGADAAVY